MDIKMEKAGNYELTPRVADPYFEVDQPRSTINSG